MPLFVGGPLDGHRREYPDNPRRVHVPRLVPVRLAEVPAPGPPITEPTSVVTYERHDYEASAHHRVVHSVYSVFGFRDTLDYLVRRYPGAPESDWIGDIPSELSVLADKFEESGSAEWAVLLRRAATEIDGLRSALSERNEMLQNPLRFLTRTAAAGAPAGESPGSRSPGRGT